MDLQNILLLSPDKIDNDLKDDLYNYISFINIDAWNLDRNKMKNLVKITQEVLKYKGEQVDSLISEFDEMARKQGEEETKTIKYLENEIRSLKSSGSRQKAAMYDSEYEEIKLKVRNQKISMKMQKQEIEKLTQEVMILREENNNLQTEINLGQQDSDSQSISESHILQDQAMIENIRLKNKQISKLLSDIETIEKENIILQENVTSLKNELSTATEHINQITLEMVALKNTMKDYEDESVILKQQNEAFKNQIQELVNEKKQRDTQLDDFSIALDTRVDELKKLLEEKQKETEELKTQIIDLNKKIPATANETYLNLAEKENQIEELQVKLNQATMEIDSSSALLEKLASEKGQICTHEDESIVINDLKSQLHTAHERSQELQMQASAAEQDAQNQGQQLSDLITQLRKYENGQYGLSDALQEVQKYRKQVQVRDKQITNLIHDSNKLQSICDKLEQEKYILREKLKLPADAPIVTSGIISKQHKQKKLIHNLQNRIELLEDEKLQIKVKQHKYKNLIKYFEQQIIQFGGKPISVDQIDVSPREKFIVEDSEYEKRYAEAVEENEQLRKGMHEILESIKSKNDSGTYDIKSQVLEKLLQTLDARQLSGWYHPAMRYQAEVHTLQGINDELRSQLKETRLELHMNVDQLRQSEIKIKEWQNQVDNSQTTSKEKEEMVSKTDEEKQDANESEKLTEEHKSPKKELENESCVLCKQNIEEKESWMNKYEQSLKSEKLFEKTITELQNKLEEYCKSIDFGSNGEGVANKIANDFVILNRKSIFLEENESKISNENTNLKTELTTLEAKFSNQLKEQEIIKNDLLFKISILENNLKNSVSNEKIEDANKKYCELNVKYREVLHNEEKLFKESNDLTQFKKQIELLNSEKNYLNNELLKLKTIINMEKIENGQTEELSKQLANSELKQLSEKQRADHINSLYELVKDQLGKCEERCREIDNHNKMLIASNLKLQLTQQELQDKLINCVTQEDLKIVENKKVEFQEELQTLKIKYEQLLNRKNILEAEVKKKETLKNHYDTEFMSLKHLVLDLQSASDDKALIARLGQDLVMARLCESDSRNKIDVLKKEMLEITIKDKEKEKLLNEKNIQLNNLTTAYDNKYRIFTELIEFLRKQYLGCIPLTTQEIFSDVIRQSFIDYQSTYSDLRYVQKQKNDLVILEEKLEIETKNVTELKSLLSSEGDIDSIQEKINSWNEEKNSLQLSEMRLRRNFELKNTQLEQALERLKKQDIQLADLEEEILYVNNNVLDISSSFVSESTKASKKQKPIEMKNIATDPCFVETKVITITKEIQTAPLVNSTNNNKNEEIISSLREEVKQQEKQIMLKDSNLQDQCRLITDLEQNVEALRLQLIEKEHQDLQTLTEPTNERQQINVIDDIDLEEHNKLKRLVNNLQVLVTQKEDGIMRYEKMIKELRDEHSLAASRFQEEIKQLQFAVVQSQKLKPVPKQQVTKITQASLDPLPNRIAFEKYVSQVHDLEGHMCDLETSVSTLKSQLQASREECMRWRTLANDRLNTIDELRKEFNGHYEDEILTYKEECEKYKSDCNVLKQEISKLRIDLSHRESTVSQQLQEKESRIHELNMTILQLQNNLKINTDDIESQMSPHITELEMSKQLLQTECDAMKKRYNQLLQREKNAREEIRTLKGQLIKRPFLSARNERNDRGYKDQLQKKVASLEKDLSECQQKLEKEISINESRRIKSAEDFTLWDKQKRWQQTAEKYKEKLNTKSEEYERLQQNLSSAKVIINRLERERHGLEGKLKMVKITGSTISINRLETLELENAQLQGEIEILANKLEMHQHHSGGLGASLLEEKLEAQERKIAVLEVSAKGSVEVTAELERLNSTVSSLQKANLRLEAENLELRLDLEKAGTDTPYLKEQIQHLERYIEVLRAERDEQHVVTSAGDQLQPTESGKRVTELEKTVLSLRRLVEKLQAENKRLQTRPCTTIDKKIPDKIQIEFKKLKEQYGDNVQKYARLEEELGRSQKRVKFLENFQSSKNDEGNIELQSELVNTKAQLAHKTQLLDKVKILLQRAASKEKDLQEQVTRLKMLIPSGSQTD